MKKKSLILNSASSVVTDFFPQSQAENRKLTQTQIPLEQDNNLRATNLCYQQSETNFGAKIFPLPDIIATGNFVCGRFKVLRTK